MADANELMFDSDSDSEQFEGFLATNLNNNNNNNVYYDVTLTEEEIAEIEEEDGDPNFEAYDDSWLPRFTQIVGPIDIDDPTPYAIFSKIFDDTVIELLVTETNRYYDQYIRHFPAMTPAGSRSKPNCEVCSDRSKGKAGVRRHQTSHFCVECRVPLCPYPCFQRYHTLVNYKVVCTPELHK